ncbi:MAG: phosphoglucosamine mutase, partial [Pseudomonadota bacterium]
GFNLGGEQSGHIVMADHATTGDGLLAGLQFVSAMIDSGKSASTLARNFDPFPQKMENVRYAKGTDPLETAPVKAAIAAAEAQLAAAGRLLIRKSGTEPVIRVMAEHEDAQVIDAAIATVVAEIEASAA